LQASPKSNSPHAKIGSNRGKIPKSQNATALTIQGIPAFCKHLPPPWTSRKPKPCMDLHPIPQPSKPEQTQMLAFSTNLLPSTGRLTSQP